MCKGGGERGGRRRDVIIVEGRGVEREGGCVSGEMQFDYLKGNWST